MKDATVLSCTFSLCQRVSCVVLKFASIPLSEYKNSIAENADKLRTWQIK